jgi:hypothetical protein
VRLPKTTTYSALRDVHFQIIFVTKISQYSLSACFATADVWCWQEEPDYQRTVAAEEASHPIPLQSALGVSQQTALFNPIKEDTKQQGRQGVTLFDTPSALKWLTNVQPCHLCQTLSNYTVSEYLHLVFEQS